MSEKPTYWVRSKQPNEIGIFGRRPVPAQFNKLEDAQRYRRELNLRKGAFHPQLSPQKRPTVISSKPATVQVFGTRVSTPSKSVQQGRFDPLLFQSRFIVAGPRGKCGKRFVLSKQLVGITKEKQPKATDFDFHSCGTFHRPLHLGSGIWPFC